MLSFRKPDDCYWTCKGLSGGFEAAGEGYVLQVGRRKDGIANLT